MRKLLFSFKGRIGRVEYVAGLVMVLMLMVIMFGGIFMLIRLYPNPLSPSDKQMVGNVGGGLAIVMFGLTIWMKFALAVKRLHDTGQSGAYSLILLIPYVGLALVPILLVVRGESSTNRFGEIPEDVWNNNAPREYIPKR